MELLARGQGTASQSIKLSALMLAAMGYAFFSLNGPPTSHSNLFQQGKHRCAGGSALALTMPRVRGRPRRGAGWYAADSRRKRHQRFSRAMLLAKKKRRGGATVANSPPRTYVEEDLSITLPLDFSESRMFVVPDNWDPPTSFGYTSTAPNLGDSPTPTIAPSANSRPALWRRSHRNPSLGRRRRGQRRLQGKGGGGGAAGAYCRHAAAEDDAESKGSGV
jgi:hypothetical protein